MSASYLDTLNGPRGPMGPPPAAQPQPRPQSQPQPQPQQQPNWHLNGANNANGWHANGRGGGVPNRGAAVPPNPQGPFPSSRPPPPPNAPFQARGGPQPLPHPQMQPRPQPQPQREQYDPFRRAYGYDSPSSSARNGGGFSDYNAYGGDMRYPGDPNAGMTYRGNTNDSGRYGGGQQVHGDGASVQPFDPTRDNYPYRTQRAFYDPNTPWWDAGETAQAPGSTRRRKTLEDSWWEKTPRPGTRQYPMNGEPYMYGTDGTTIQGDNSRQSWHNNYGTERVAVTLGASGRHSPINSKVELWQGPNHTPHKVKVHSEDGYMRPFRAIVETNPHMTSVVDVKNDGPMSFPIRADVTPVMNHAGVKPTITIQGGSLKTFPMPHNVASVVVNLETDGMPLQCKVELWHGPGQAKQVNEVENDRGEPFSAILDTLGEATTVCVRNDGPMAFPLKASVTPYSFY